MALSQVIPISKQRGGKGGLIGKIVGGGIGAGVGLLTAGPGGAAAGAMTGFGVGSTIGGTAGAIADPVKASQSSALQGALSSDLGAMFLKTKDAKDALNDPSVPEPDRQRLGPQLQRTMDAIKMRMTT